MPDYGKYIFDDAVGGAVMELSSGQQENDLVTRVAYLGPRRWRGYRTSGTLQIFAADDLCAQIYATPTARGRLELYGTTTNQEIASEQFSAFLAGCAAGGGSARWGFLELRALRTGNYFNAENVVEIGTDHSGGRGSLRLYDSGRLKEEAFAVLELDNQGPILILRNGDRTISISPEGIRMSPDKAGLADALEVPGDRVPGARPVPNVDPLPPGEINLVANHPTNPSMQIHYNVIEGPEVGLYVRGTTRLERGRATAVLPDHFAAVASAGSLTVQLTPRSPASKGLAAESLTVHELRIAELGRGTGEYDVDYFVQGIRRGREDFAVVRPRRSVVVRGAMDPDRPSADGDDAPG